MNPPEREPARTGHWPWARARLLPVFLLLIAFQRPANGAKPPPTSDSALILYDSTGQYGWIGEVHSRLLANLLGHFPCAYQIVPVENYHAGDLGRYKAGFYLGSSYDNPLPVAFLQDALTTTNPLCWFKYNLLQLDDGAAMGAQFETKFGFRFEFIDSGFGAISYKGESFTKNELDPDLGRTTILDPNRALVHFGWPLIRSITFGWHLSCDADGRGSLRSSSRHVFLLRGLVTTAEAVAHSRPDNGV